MQNEAIKAKGLKTVMKNTKLAMGDMHKQMHAEYLADLQPHVDSGDLSIEERDRLIKKYCAQWDIG